jgi:hypothetical protein
MEQKMCVMTLSATFAWNSSPFKKNWARYDQKFMLVFTTEMRIESDPKTVTQFLKISYTAVFTVHIGKNKREVS